MTLSKTRLLTREEAIRELAIVEYNNLSRSDVIEMIEDGYQYETNETIKELYEQTHSDKLKLRKGGKPEPNKIINITVRGGLIQNIENIPIGMTIRVRDYDTDGDEDRTIKDKNGKRCFQADWMKE